MTRPMKPRRIGFNPRSTYFKPRAVPLYLLGEVEIGRDELEALRFCDLKNLDQDEAAKRMRVSRSTLQRILTSARQKISEALIGGKAINVSMG